MRTAIDTNVLSAVWSGEPSATQVVQHLGKAKRDGALMICPVVFSELHAYPGATEEFIARFLHDSNITVDYSLEAEVWSLTGKRFARYAERRRKSAGMNPRRLVADFLIGAHSVLQADRLFTLDPKVYMLDFPEIELYSEK